MSRTESRGLATKKSRDGIVRPGVGPFAQVVPEESVRARDEHAVPALASSVQERLLRLTGVVARVVYGGLGKDCAGRARTPAKTWFQTPLLPAVPMLLLRISHCCCDPLMTVPVTASRR